MSCELFSVPRFDGALLSHHESAINNLSTRGFLVDIFNF
jgi:hypothetical protein